MTNRPTPIDDRALLCRLGEHRIRPSGHAGAAMFDRSGRAWFSCLPMADLRVLLDEFPGYDAGQGHYEGPSALTIAHAFEGGEVSGYVLGSLLRRPAIRVAAAILTFANEDDIKLFFDIYPPSEIDREPAPLDDVMVYASWDPS